MSRRLGWWWPVASAMQGLKALYEYQGRLAEWSRLVTEIVPDYCTDDDDPMPGREDSYTVVMGYRVALAQDHHRDLPQAATLQEKRVAWNRQQAAAALALQLDAPLNAGQRSRIRSLAVSMETLGHILREQCSSECVHAYEETVNYSQRIGDKAEEAIAHYNIGHAYKNLPDIRDPDAAEAAYQRELALLNPLDESGRASTTIQIGAVHHDRFNESLSDSAPENIVRQHAQAVESHYRQALALCPATAITVLGPIHNQLGKFYVEIGRAEQAREHYEKCVQYDEQTGNRFGAGRTRFNMALMYLSTASRESRRPSRRRCYTVPRLTPKPPCETSSTTKAAPPTWKPNACN